MPQVVIINKYALRFESIKYIYIYIQIVLHESIVTLKVYDGFGHTYKRVQVYKCIDCVLNQSVHYVYLTEHVIHNATGRDRQQINHMLVCVANNQFLKTIVTF
jgi:hypothetical protein